MVGALPPLRARPEDVPYLTAAFVASCARRLKKVVLGVTPAAERALGLVRLLGRLHQHEALGAEDLRRDAGGVVRRDRGYVLGRGAERRDRARQLRRRSQEWQPRYVPVQSVVEAVPVEDVVSSFRDFQSYERELASLKAQLDRLTRIRDLASKLRDAERALPAQRVERQLTTEQAAAETTIKHPALLGITRDITERRKLESRLGLENPREAQDVNYAKLQSLEATLNLWLRRVSEAMARASRVSAGTWGCNWSSSCS